MEPFLCILNNPDHIFHGARVLLRRPGELKVSCELMLE